MQEEFITQNRINLYYSKDNIKTVKDKIDKPYLLVKAKATHAGRLTGNGGLYLPYRMAQSARAWTTPYKRPVLTQHNEDGEPIGRVVGATYVKEPDNSIGQEYVRIVNNAKSAMDPKLIPLFKKIKNRLFNPNFQGLGYMDLSYTVVDYLAIEKILDERLLTLSVSMRSNAKICSVCGHDFRSDECDHYVGQMVDGQIVFGVYDILKPIEVSYVNVPADPFAMTSEISWENRDNYKPEQDFMEFIQDSEVVLFEPGNKIYTISNSGGNMKITMKSLLANTVDNYKILKDYLPKDATPLSDDELNKLPEDSFIGPNKTFPVIDMAHVEAIEKLMEKVNDSAAKREFMEVFQNAKDSIEERTKAEEAKEVLLSSEALAKLENDELKLAYQLTEKLMKERNLIEDSDNNKNADDDELEVALNVVKKHNQQLQQMLSVIKDSVKEMTNELTNAYAHMIVDLKKRLSMPIEDEDKYIASLKTRTVQSLKDMYNDLRDSIKDGDTYSKVDDPTLKAKHDVDSQDQEKIREHYNFLMKTVGIDAAQDYLRIKIENGEFNPDEKEKK